MARRKNSDNPSTTSAENVQAPAAPTDGAPVAPVAPVVDSSANTEKGNQTMTENTQTQNVAAPAAPQTPAAPTNPTVEPRRVAPRLVRLPSQTQSALTATFPLNTYLNNAVPRNFTARKALVDHFEQMWSDAYDQTKKVPFQNVAAVSFKLNAMLKNLQSLLRRDGRVESWAEALAEYYEMDIFNPKLVYMGHITEMGKIQLTRGEPGVNPADGQKRGFDSLPQREYTTVKAGPTCFFWNVAGRAIPMDADGVGDLIAYITETNVESIQNAPFTSNCVMGSSGLYDGETMVLEASKEKPYTFHDKDGKPYTICQTLRVSMEYKLYLMLGPAAEEAAGTADYGEVPPSDQELAHLRTKAELLTRCLAGKRPANGDELDWVWWIGVVEDWQANPRINRKTGLVIKTVESLFESDGALAGLDLDSLYVYDEFREIWHEIQARRAGLRAERQAKRDAARAANAPADGVAGELKDYSPQGMAADSLAYDFGGFGG